MTSSAAQRAALSTPSFASCSWTPWNARLAIRSDTVNPMPGDRTAACERAPSDRQLQPPPAEPRGEPGGAEEPDGLAHDIRNEDAERHGRREGAREEAAVDRDARVRKREERHDHVARPRVVEVLQPLVRRDRVLEPDLRGARKLGRRLLAEQPEQVGGALEVDARGRIRVGEQPHHEADDHRVDARLEDGDPHRRAEHGVRRAPAGRRTAARTSTTARNPAATASGDDVEAHGVDDRDHEQRDDVVDDGRPSA